MLFVWNCEQCGRLLDADSVDVAPDGRGWFVVCPVCLFASSLINSAEPGRPRRFIKAQAPASMLVKRRDGVCP